MNLDSIINVKIYGSSDADYLNEVVVADIVVNSKFNSIEDVYKVLKKRLPVYKLPYKINIVNNIQKIKNYKTI